MAKPWEKYANAKPWEKYGTAPAPTPTAPSIEESAPMAITEGISQGATLGYLPEIQAATEKYITDPLAGAIYGSEGQKPESFIEKLNKYRGREEQIQKANPKTYGASSLLGSLAIPIPGSSSATLAGRVGSTALKSAAMSGLANTGQDYSSLKDQLEQRAKNAAMGGAFGAGGQFLAEGAATIPQAFAKIKDYAALKQTGANAGQIGGMLKKGQTKDVVKFMDENGLMKVGNNPETVLEKSSAIVDDTGKKIGETYSKVIENAQKGANLENATPAQIEKFMATQLDPVQMADDLYINAASELKGTSGGKQALSALQDELVNLKDVEGQGIEGVLNYRKSLDDQLAKTYNKVGDKTPREDALVTLRRQLKKRIDQHMGAVDSISGNADSKALVDLNKEYSIASKIKDVSQKKVGREIAKTHALELLTGAGATGMSLASGQDLEHSLLRGIGAAAAMKTGRYLGPSTLYQTSKLMSQIPARQIVEKAATNIPPWLMMNKQGEK